MATFEVRVIGVDELKRRVIALGEQALRALQPVALDSAMRAARAAQQRVPVRTGLLRSAITAEPRRPSGGEARVLAVAGIQRGHPAEIYAPIVEFGDPGTRTGRPRQATPYLYPAYEVERPGHVTRVVETMRKLIMQANSYD